MNNNTFGKVLLLLVFVLASHVLVAQETPIVKVDGVKYLIHYVEKGQTLYAISKKFSISIEEIRKANSDLADNGLKIGQSLRIPQKKIDKKDFKKSNVSISGDTIIHEVFPKETMYSLSKKYNISQDSIKIVNPIIEKEGLEIGLKLKIPVKKAIVEKEEDVQAAVEDSLILHMVEAKETLYSLAAKYKVSQDSIQIVNDGLKDGLKIGTTIRIPKANPNFVKQEEVIKDSLSTDSLAPQTKPLEIAFVLPFYLTKNFEVDSNLLELKEKAEVNKYKSSVPLFETVPEIYKKSRIALDFYQGAKIAIDSLSKEGLWANIRIYDTENNKDTIRSILKDTNLRNADLIIGPMYKSNFTIVAQFAKENNIPIVSPVKVSSKILLSKPTAYKVFSSNPAQVIQLAKYIGENYADSNLFLLNSARYADEPIVAVFQKYMNRALEHKGDTIKRIDIYTYDENRLKPYLKDSTHYVVALPSSNQVYVSQFLNSMNDVYLSQRGIEFTIFGLEKWLEFDNIDVSHLHNLNVHFPSSRHIDYQDTAIIDLVLKFRERYQTDPEQFGLLGFDVSYHFIKSLMTYREHFLTEFPRSKGTMLTTKYDFVKVGEESGYENQSAFILKIEDFELKRVK